MIELLNNEIEKIEFEIFYNELATKLKLFLLYGKTQKLSQEKMQELIIEEFVKINNKHKIY